MYFIFALIKAYSIFSRNHKSTGRQSCAILCGMYSVLLPRTKNNMEKSMILTLRFFLSSILDKTVDINSKDNLGIRKKVSCVSILQRDSQMEKSVLLLGCG